MRSTTLVLLAALGCGPSEPPPAEPVSAVATAGAASNRPSPSVEASATEEASSGLTVRLGVARFRGVALTADTTLAQLLAALGPGRVEQADGATFHIHDELGVSVRAGDQIELTFFLVSSGLVLPGGDVFQDPTEPTGLYADALVIEGAPLPERFEELAPTTLTCDRPSDNIRCEISEGTRLFVSHQNGTPSLVTVAIGPR